MREAPAPQRRAVEEVVVVALWGDRGSFGGNGGLQLGTGAGVQQQRRPADAKGGTAAHGFIFGIGDARILQLFQ